MPVGYWLFKLNKTYSDYQQQQEGTVTNFELTGNSNDNKASINYVVSRDNKTKVSLFNHLKTRERHSFIDGTEIVVQQLNLTEIEAGINFRQYIGRSVLDISLSGHKGLERLGADSVNNDEDNTEFEQPNYRFYSLVSSFNHPFSVFEKNLNYSAQFFAQYTDVAIYSLDWFSIGGRYTVRGYESDQGLSSDKGWRLKNDISLPIRISQYAATSYLGFDIGQVFGEGIEDENESENTLAGLTLGIKGKLLGANYDLFASTPFLAYGPYASASDYTISASLSAQF